MQFGSDSKKVARLPPSLKKETYNMGSNINERFPAEVIKMILSHLNSIEVARLSRVCKLWNDIAQSNQSLWRDASYLRTDDAFTFRFRLSEVVERIKILRARSGGTLDHLNIQINTIASFKTQMKLLSQLPAMKLQSLRLLLKDGREWAFRDDDSDFDDSDSDDFDDSDSDSDSDDDDYHYNMTAREKFKSLQKAVRAALSGCTNLKSLALEDYGKLLSILDLSRSESEFYPPSEWELQSFTANGFCCEEFFGEGSLSRCLNKARVVKIQNSSPMREREAIRLIEAAKDTMEECQITVRKEQESPNNITKQIILPKLVKFHLHLCGCHFSEGKSSIQAFDKISFKWPKLKEIVLEGRASLKVYERLVPTSIDSLRFRRVRGFRLEQIIEFLKKRAKLRKLAVEHLEEDTETLLQQILINLWQIPIEDLEIIGAHGLHATNIKDFVTQRKENIYSAPLERLYLTLRSKSSSEKPMDAKTLQWLDKNIPNFKCDLILERTYR
ncbi:uncharacterized protein FA14DRAFT_61699 [Meira miltonrushii]|uniref:F-box domain-containing protein n=1 Tax=Meira miltonrushii TaxID=1280837 RepID=A0A316V787_9BASI|nr:uncharacterized protein FA14DRAFT_61699 [Meira miltonrushii]PWN33386.1 hypothetical protein FA14DRAFT_61699 [Meira miltonrushii]